MRKRACVWALLVAVAAAAPARGGPAAARLVLRPSTARPGQSVLVRGSGFHARLRVSVLLVVPRSDEHVTLATVRASVRGSFSTRFRVNAGDRAGRYGVVACESACRVKAQAALRVKG